MLVECYIVERDHSFSTVLRHGDPCFCQHSIARLQPMHHLILGNGARLATEKDIFRIFHGAVENDIINITIMETLSLISVRGWPPVMAAVSGNILHLLLHKCFCHHNSCMWLCYRLLSHTMAIFVVCMSILSHLVSDLNCVRHWYADSPNYSSLWSLVSEQSFRFRLKSKCYIRIQTSSDADSTVHMQDCVAEDLVAKFKMHISRFVPNQNACLIQAGSTVS